MCSEWDTYFHAGRIAPGDLTLVTTYFPSDENVRWFGVESFTRTRRCEECTWHWVQENRLSHPLAIEYYEQMKEKWQWPMPEK